MGKLIEFSNKLSLTIRSGRQHIIAVKVIDTIDPRLTRWVTHFFVQEAEFNTHTGFTDELVANGDEHRFNVTSTRAVRRFIAGTLHLVSDEKLAIWVDGVRVHPLVTRRA